MFTDLTSYLYMIPAVFIGVLIGFLIAPLISPANRKSDQSPAPEDLLKKSRTVIDEKKIKHLEAQHVLIKTEDKLMTTNQMIEHAMNELSKRELKLADVKLLLDEKRVLFEEHKSEFDEIDERLTAHEIRTKELSDGGDAMLEEIKALEAFKDQQTKRRDRLLQTVQNLTNELSLLEGDRIARTQDLQEAEKLRNECDTYLSRLHRERRVLETEINRLKQDIAEQSKTLKQLSNHQRDQTNSTVQVPRAALPAAGFTEGQASDQTTSAHASTSRVNPDRSPDLLDGEDDIALINGMTPFYKTRLQSKGITTYAQLAQAQPEDLWRLLSIPSHFQPQIADWISHARELYREQIAQEL